MGDTLRVTNTQRGANTQIPPVNETILRPLLPASSQPRKFEQYAESTAAAGLNGNAATKPKETPGTRSDSVYFQNFAPHGLPLQGSRHNSSLFLFNTPRHDLFSFPNNFPIVPPVPPAAPPTAMQNPGAQAPRQGYPNYYPTGRDSVSFPIAPGEIPGRIRGDSISLPHPFPPSKYPENDALNFPMQQGAPNNPPGHNPLRSTSIFSSLIQLPGSSRNSVSGPSSKDMGRPEGKQKPSVSSNRGGYAQEYDAMGKESLGNIFGWNQAPKASPGNSKRNTKVYDNANAFWDQMGHGMPAGSIAGVSNDSINAFLSNLQHNGSIDFLNMSNEQRRDSIMKFITDQGLRSEAPPLMGTSLREDIFDDQRKTSYGSKGNRSSISEMNHVSPTSSMSSKNSKLRDEPHSPKTSPARNPTQTIDQISGMPLRGNQPNAQSSRMNVPQRHAPAYYAPQQQDPFSYSYQEPVPPFQAPQMRASISQYQAPPGAPPIPPQQQQYMGGQQSAQAPYTNTGQATDNTYPSMFKGSQYVSPEVVEQLNYYPKVEQRSPGQMVDPNGKRLVQAQQYARAEDGRPLLGATKVDQLMLVIQAREKGNTTEIKQTTDGSILASPNMDHDKNAVLPLTVDLVGGIEKPPREADPETENGEPNRKRKRRGKAQECPYCFKQFHQSTHLDVHVRSHIGLKPFECTFCGKRFTQGGNLRTHMRLHTGEKPFVCDICNRNFSRKGNLAAHMLTHNKEKPFECKLDNCDKSFTQLGNLKSHQNKFHLPTLTKLTQTFASITGDALAQLPEDEKELLEYFAKLYKNANKGIRGRGKGKRVMKIDANGNELTSPAGSTHTSPEQLAISMANPQNGNGQAANMVKPNGGMGYNQNIQKYG